MSNIASFDPQNTATFPHQRHLRPVHDNIRQPRSRSSTNSRPHAATQKTTTSGRTTPPELNRVSPQRHTTPDPLRQNNPARRAPDESGLGSDQTARQVVYWQAHQTERYADRENLGTRPCDGKSAPHHRRHRLAANLYPTTPRFSHPRRTRRPRSTATTGRPSKSRSDSSRPISRPQPAARRH